MKCSRGFAVVALAAGLTLSGGSTARAQGAGQPSPWTDYGTSLYATGSDVWVRFFGSDAGFHNSLFYACDLALSCQQFLFDNHDGAFNGGEEAHINSTFTPGQEVIFMLSNDQGNNWFTGPADRNSDGYAHFATQSWADVTPNANYSVLGGFEDFPGGGDGDHNDIMFEFGNVSTTATPEPASLALLATGFVGVGGMFRRRRSDTTED